MKVRGERRLQALVDPFNPPGLLNYHRVMHLSGLPDEAIDTYVEYATEIVHEYQPPRVDLCSQHHPPGSP